jgi:hypothetical protein
MGKSVGIDGREYKLLLDQAGFLGKPFPEAARAFWHDRLKPLIDDTLDAKEGNRSRAEGALRLKKRRRVLFLDTKDGLLANRKIALRSRTLFQDGEFQDAPEVTLKFRTPDLLRAAEYCRIADEGNDETILEEDIAPFQVARANKPIAVAKPLSIRSQFSVSTKRGIETKLKTLGDVFGSFNALTSLFERPDAAADAKLRAGPTIYEWVFQFAFVDLGAYIDGRDLNAGFGFTLWHFPKAGTKGHPFGERERTAEIKPRIAEISYDFKTKGGRMDARAAERALALFVAMHETLHVNRHDTSKTALALPAPT